MSLFRTQFALNFSEEIIVDLFAGGGGASTGLEIGLKRPVTIAINHNPNAVSMHEANHPHAEHYVEDVFAVNPMSATRGRPVGWLHASPDCTHHSQARGGQPRSAEIRSLSWVVVKWAAQVRPRVISLENVRQIVKWSPLVAKRCKKTGRVVRLDGTVAASGEVVPRHEQFLVPCKRREGKHWQRFLNTLRGLGYSVQHRQIDAADHGAATNRRRLFLIARRDGQPIVWPEPTRHEKPRRGQHRWSVAADHLDFTLPCPSIFLSKEEGRALGVKRPLVDSTCRRIALGVQRYVLNNPRPFIVPVTHSGCVRVHDSLEPLRTITTAQRGEFMVAAPTLVQAAHGLRRAGDRRGALDVYGPLETIHAGGGSFAVATAWMVQHNNHRGIEPSTGRRADVPLSTISTSGSQQGLAVAHLTTFRRHSTGAAVDGPLPGICASGEHHGLVSAFLSRQFGSSIGQDVSQPVPTITASGGGKTALVECLLAPEDEVRALRVAAFLMRYHGSGGQWAACDEPLTTISTRDRLALVTVWLQGEPWVIVDIGLRMLTPLELYACQGFPPEYIFTHGHDGRRFSKAQQVFFCGNSVSPPPMAAIARANNPWAEQMQERAA